MITSFHTPETEFLSNFYLCCVPYEGFIYPSAENAYQAAKTLNIKARSAFTLEEMTPAMAKHLGKIIKIRSDWDQEKLQVMWDILSSKFEDHDLKRLLLATGDQELVEGNNWGDVYWGVCKGKGENNLGRLLMNLRKKLNDEQFTNNL